MSNKTKIIVVGQGLSTRAIEKIKDTLHYRQLAVRTDETGVPSTLDDEKRSVEVIGATENPVEVYDWERYEVVKEILLMEGCELPQNNQVPLLDAHSRYSTASVMGSYRELEILNGQLMGRAYFSTVGTVEDTYTKVKEGHLTDFSIGYRVIESTWIPDGQKAKIRGGIFEGPVKVATRWRLKELSTVPIGADEMAKARTDVVIDNPINQRTEGQNMTPEELKALQDKIRKELELEYQTRSRTDIEAAANESANV